LLSRPEFSKRGISGKSRNEDWDLIIADEAHKLSAHYFGNKVNETRCFKLGKLLRLIGTVGIDAEEWSFGEMCGICVKKKFI